MNKILEEYHKRMMDRIREKEFLEAFPDELDDINDAMKEIIRSNGEEVLKLQKKYIFRWLCFNRFKSNF